MMQKSNIEDLYKLIDDSIDAVSFDFFDTLYTRPLCDPEDIFDLIGIKMGIGDFRERRRRAQVLGFQKMHRENRREITIDDIYSCFDIEPAAANEAKQLEIDLELELTVPNPEMVEFLAYCASRKRVAIVSDMYLGREFFDAILKKHSISVADIFVSSDLGMTKRDTGEIFDRVSSVLGIEPHRILHVGDSLHSDVTRGGEKGFRTFHYREGRKPVQRSGQSFADSLATALHRTVVPSRMDRFYDYGYRYGGSALVSFVDYLQKEAQEDCIDLLLFVSRDGFIIDEVTSLDARFSAKRVYLKGSRTAFSLAAINESNFDGFVPFLLSGCLGLSPYELFERIDVVSPSDKVLSDLGLGAHVEITAENLSEIAKLVRACRWSILMRCREVRRGLYTYLSSLGVRDGMRVALVDVGWAGTTLDAFEKAIRDMFDLHVVGYFLCLVNSPECLERRGRLEMKAMLEPANLGEGAIAAIYKNRVAAELMFSAPHPSVIAYRMVQDQAVPVEDCGRGKTATYNEATEAMLVGMREYYVHFNQVRNRIGLETDSLSVAAPFIDFMTNMPDEVKQTFSAVKNFDAWGSSKNFDLKASDYMV